MEGNVEGERGSSMLERCASQSSLDESSQRPQVGAPQPPHHAAKLLDSLSQLRRDDVLCDVRLVAGAAPPSAGVTESAAGDAPPHVSAHRALLAACSPYFRAMFTQFDERTQHSITIQNVDHQSLQAIVDYIYNPDTLVITEDNVQALLSCASLLAVCGVRALCCGFLAAQLSADNALGIAAFAEAHGCAELAASAALYAERHFEDVARGDEFLALDAPAVCRVLGSDALCASGEEAVLEAAVRWVAAEPARAAHLPAVLERVRLPLVPREALLARARSPPLAAGPVRVKDLLIEALSYHLLRPDERAAAAADCARARPRRPPAAPRALLVAGGQAPKAIRDVEAYHFAEGRWRPTAELASRRCRAGLAAVDGRVYAVGGFNGALRVRTVDVYDVATDSWAPGPSMLARRSTLGVAVVGHEVFAVGGFDGSTGLSSAEALDTRTGVWRELAPMSTRRSSVGVAVLEGLVYAVGGYDGASRQCLASVERYRPARDAWEPVPEMGARRSGAGVGAVDGALYAVGGHDGPAVRRSVEAWRPGEAAWREAAPMCAARRNAAVAALDGRLYVVGGDDGACNLSSVEVYEPASDQWTLLTAAMAVGRSYAGVAVVECPPRRAPASSAASSVASSAPSSAAAAAPAPAPAPS